MWMMLRKSVPLLALCLLAGSSVGCAGGRSASLLAWWPPWAERDEVIPGVQTAEQRIEQLRQLAGQAEGAPMAEQHRISLELAGMIRTEMDPLVRIEIVRTIAQYPTEPAAAVLRAALEDPQADVRVACCRAWAQRKGPEAVRLLADTLGRDGDIDVRLTAADALADVGDPQAVSALGVALEDSDPALQRRAMASLRTLTGRDYDEDVNLWREYLRDGNPQRETPSLVERLSRLF